MSFDALIPNSIVISGVRLSLGPLSADLAPFYNQLRNDLRVQKTAGLPLYPVSLDQTLKNMEEGWASNETASHFTVYQQAGWRPIGYANLRDIDYFHGVAEFGISLHREFWNQGFGTETAKLVLAYGFRMLNLHSIYLTVDGVNPGGQRAYSKAGFREVGRYREAVIVERERYDLIMMDCLAREFTPPEVLTWGPPDAKRA